MPLLKMASVLVQQPGNRNTIPSTVPAYEVPVLKAIYAADGGVTVTGESFVKVGDDFTAATAWERLLTKYSGGKDPRKALQAAYPTEQYFEERFDRHIADDKEDKKAPKERATRASAQPAKSGAAPSDGNPAEDGASAPPA